MTKEKGKTLDITDRTQMFSRMFGTMFSKTATKLWPAIRDGRGTDFFRHLGGVYPSKELKERREKINKYSKKHTGHYIFKHGRKKKGPPTFDEKLDNLLKELQSRA